MQSEQFYPFNKDLNSLICFDTQEADGFIQLCDSAIRNVLLIIPRYIKN